MIYHENKQTTNQFLQSVQYFLQVILFSICVPIFLQKKPSPKKSIKSGTMYSLLKLTLFSYFIVHSLRTVAVRFNIFSYIKRNWSFRTHISRSIYLNSCDYDVTSNYKLTRLTYVFFVFCYVIAYGGCT